MLYNCKNHMLNSLSTEPLYYYTYMQELSGVYVFENVK